MKQLLLSLIFCLIVTDLARSQEDIVYTDYMTFGRKEPASLGSVFSALANEPIFLNPANVAMITDNRITIGGSTSDLGTSYMLAWTAPNISISSAMHKASINDSAYNEYQKELLKFSFGLSSDDLGFHIKNTCLALGVAVKRLSDIVSSPEKPEFGGEAMSIDLGFNIYWQFMAFEMAVLNINSPNMGETDLSYSRAFSFTTRYVSPTGFMIALQGINSTTYAGSDIGINLAAQQSFYDQRLTSRIQLTSFFSGTEATMQNISGSVGYRPVVPEKLYFLQDLEFSYALSFLALPQNVGTHLIVLTKYF
jgi:hypothetical protein